MEAPETLEAFAVALPPTVDGTGEVAPGGLPPTYEFLVAAPAAEVLLVAVPPGAPGTANGFEPAAPLLDAVD